MKGLKSIAIAVLFLTASVAAGHAQVIDGKKIGTMDLSRVFDEYTKTKEYDTSLEAKHKEFEKERNAKIDKLKAAQAKLPALKDAEKNKVQGEIDAMINDLKTFDSQKQMDFKKERDEKIREILLEIEKVVSDFAQKESFAFILNDRVLIYGSEGFDITDQMIKLLNDSYSKKK